MKISILLLALFCAFSVIFADVTALQFVVFELNVTRDWTPEEILDSQPIPLPMVEYTDLMNNKSFIEELEPANTRECQTPNTFPFNAAGKILIQGSGYCSGSYVGNGLVLTAGHCVSNGRGRYHTAFTFCPSHKDGSCPRGQFHATKAITHAEYHNKGNLARDVAFIRITGNPGQALDMLYNHGRTDNVEALGYPQNIGRGQRMIQTTGKMAPGRRLNPEVISLRSTMTQGSSGGPWITPRGIGSVVSHGTPGTGVIFGPYFDDAIKQMRNAI